MKIIGKAYVWPSKVAPDAYLCVDTEGREGIVLKIAYKDEEGLALLQGWADALNEWAGKAGV